ncbi:MAG TPA: Hsp33 family molecular chaperone HslO [Thermoanaerobaculia bacterium]|nr:Hsp33 family molecular chaperone HslO [Thermoanaerobaculia bacterium]
MTNTETAAQGRLELGLAGDGALRWAAVDLTDVLREARDRRDLGPVSTAALGRCMAGAALLLRLSTKTPTRLVLDVRGNGPLRQVMAESDDEGNLRGMVGEARVDLPNRPDGKLNVGGAVGKGFLRVIREHGSGGSYNSQVELVTGEIGDDLAHYLEQSEQTSSAVMLGVLARPHGVAAAGGMIVEVLPGASDETIASLQENIARVRGVSYLIDEGGIPNVLDTVLSGFDREIKEVLPLRYRCRCSRERLLSHLTLLSTDDRDYLREEDGAIDADCVFCGEHYRFTPEELQSPSP